MQYYKILSTGEIYALDKSTGQATQVTSVPPGGATLSWAGSGLPPELQNAQIKKISSQQQPYVPPVVGGTPYFTGKTALIKLVGDQPGNETYWQLDTENKTIRPFESKSAFDAIYAGNLDAANSALQTVHSGDLGPGGMLNGYHVLGNEYVIRPGAPIKNVDASPSQLQARYGKDINPELEKPAYSALGGFLNILSSSQSGVSKSFVEKLRNDPNSIAYYANALAYGGYTLSDVYRDIKNKELVNNGNVGQSNIQPISASQTRDSYQNTDAGRNAYTNQAINPPQQLGGVDSTTMNLPVYNIPGEAFKTLVPIMNWNSPEFKAEMDKVNTAFSDVLQQQLNATTEQEKAVADYNWQNLKRDTEKSLGITLSNNAIDAWKQLETAREGFSQRGLTGTGMEAEGIDDYLKGVRRSDQLNREQNITKQEAQQADYYSKFATPDQIKALIEEDKAKGLPQDQWRATKWGLAPSEAVKNAFSFNALKAKYPTLTDEEINNYASSILDPNGNYRSTLYQRQAENLQKIKTDKTTYQQGQAMQNVLNKEEKAYSEFSKPTTPWTRQAEASKPDTSTSDLPTPQQPTYTPPVPKTTYEAPSSSMTQNERNMAAAGLSADQMAAVRAGVSYSPTKSTPTPSVIVPPKTTVKNVVPPTPTVKATTQYNAPVGPSPKPQTPDWSKIDTGSTYNPPVQPKVTTPVKMPQDTILGTLYKKVKSFF